MTLPAADFPFYNGQPAAFSAWQWAALMLSVAVAFAALQIPEPYHLAGFLPAILFAGIPLATLRAVAGRHWRALFARVTTRDVGIAFGVAVMNLCVTASVAVGVSHWFNASANPAGQVLAEASDGDRTLFLLMTLPQLLGEELLTMLPFLAVLTLLHARFGLTRRQAIVGAWLVSSLFFGLMHLPTYQWNWAQCILVIGTARVVLTAAYLVTRNLWVSTMAHVFNDWILFALVLLLPTLDA